MKTGPIIFDLDGTLLDTGKGIVKCVASTLGRMGFQVPEENICRSFVGPPLKKRFLELFDADEETANAVVTAFREEYGRGDLFLAERYPGMEECLTVLHGRHPLAVATNKREDQATMLLERYGMASHFDSICGSAAVAAMTKDQIVANAAERLGFRLSDCLMVGDSDNDAEAAARLGVPFVGVTYGYGFKCAADLAPFPHLACAHSPSEICAVLERLNREGTGNHG